LTSSIYPQPATPFGTPLADTDILDGDIEITPDMVKPGGGGILRLYFSFTTAAPTTISVLGGSTNTFQGNLNADNSSQIISNGYYRFDIGVEAGDLINLQSTEDITTVNLFRAHLVQFGA